MNKENHTQKGTSSYLKIIAAIALIVGIGFGVFFFLPKGPTDLMSEYFEPFEDHLSKDIALVAESRKGQEMPAVERLENAMQAYKKGEYLQASRLFGQHFRANPVMMDASKIRLYMGISQLGAGEYQKASFTLESLAGRKDYQYVEAANWYLALAEIKLDKISEAKKHLATLSNSKLYSKKAASLSKGMK